MTSVPDALVEGRATYGMANLRPERTGLPFIVFISQRDDARHGARVTVSPAPRVRPDMMSSYALSPFDHKGGRRMDATDERALAAWVALNLDVLQAYWDGAIEYTEDALARLRPLR